MDNRIDTIYGRQSVDKKDSISIESQFEFCRYGLKGGECREYKDKGYSGKNTERPDFQRLLTDIKNGLVKRVIVYKLDRISRSIVGFAKLMELFKQYNVEFVSCTEKFDTSTPMGRAMLNICIVFAQLERESIQQRVQDAFYSRCSKGYYMGGRPAYGFDLEPIVINGIKTKKLVENASMSYALLMYEMYEVSEASYGDISRFFAENNILVYGKTLKRGFIAQLLRNPVYVQADMDIYEYFKVQGVKIENDAEGFTGDFGCYLYQGREGEEKILVLAPHEGKVPSRLWLKVQHKLSQNTTFQNGRKCHNTWLAGGKRDNYNPELTTARAGLAKIEGEIEKLLDTLTGANPTLLKYANSRVEELDAQRQAQTKLIADLSTNSVSSSQIERISGYLSDWDSVDFDDRRRVIDALVTQIQATSEHVSIQWKI